VCINPIFARAAADLGGEDFKWWDEGFGVIADVHDVFAVFFSTVIKVNCLFGFDQCVVEMFGEEFFQAVSVCDVGV